MDIEAPAAISGFGHEASEHPPDEVHAPSHLSGFSLDDEPLEIAPIATESGDLSPGPRPDNLDRVLGIQVTVTARLGRVEMPIGTILSLGAGSVIDAAHRVDEPVDLLVNGKLIARGQMVVVNGRLGLRITEIVSAQERIESL
jgi:flagellar motor switch protein FliN/FliY